MTRALSQTAPCLGFPNCKREIIQIHLKIVVRFSECVRDSMMAAVIIVTVDAERAAQTSSLPMGTGHCWEVTACLQGKLHPMTSQCGDGKA